MVERALTVWNQFGEVPETEHAILMSQALWGRKSMFEDWTKLSIIASAGLSVPEVAWVLEYFIETRLSQIRWDFSNTELTQRTSPINVYVLRRVAVCGFIEKYIDKRDRGVRRS